MHDDTTTADAASGTGRPIEDYALLSDRHAAALVSADGSIDWLCRPRFDSPAVFGRLLDPEAGHWSIRPAAPFHTERSYVGDTFVLRTVFTTDTGTVHLTDALALGPADTAGNAAQTNAVDDDADERLLLAAHAPIATLRVLECTAGEMDLDFAFRPRPEYGLVTPILTAVPGGVLATGGPVRTVLTSPADLAFGHQGATARLRLRAGDRLRFAAQTTGLADDPPATWTPEAVDAALAETVQGWQDWSDAHPPWEGPLPHLVTRSILVLEALRYQPTGAIVAAPTTSLPEAVGAGRNWDYRYAWVRDASFTVQALAAAGCHGEAVEFFEFMTHAAARYKPETPLQIMFGIGGEHDLSERELGHLSGWRASRPVRVGNAAWLQPQLDVYGELLDAAWHLRGHLRRLDDTARHFLAGVADAAADQWEQPDQGIWESRGLPRHYTYSKLMCWVALDRAVKYARLLDIEGDAAPRWEAERDRVREAIETRGWNPGIGAFCAAFDGDDLDAAVLSMPAVGFLPGDDPRLVSTVDVIAARLRDPRGLVRRYESGTDGFEGAEGSFVMCTFWLAQALALTGRPGPARDAFAVAAACANDLGLMSEEVDTASGAMLGNFPQAFSHIGLINAAVAIRDAERR
ncbi:glycoside hydrolase family 15 protein [Glycomyces sp. NPDC021274]|uniref:glycoside hydrolase family 15 protein n=1 Tax=Glycomyces sp. NPDC021274 TaxID=3155120 RepID=UPI0033CAC3D1